MVRLLAIAPRAARRPAASAPLLATGVLLVLAACGGSGGGGDGGGPVVPAAVQAVDASPRAGVVGAALGEPLRVRVTDAGGRGARGVVVTWTASGGGQAAPAQSTTNADGVAESQWTLGPLAGPQEATATAGTGLATTFAAVAAADRAAIVRVGRDSVLLLAPGAAFGVTASAVDRFDNPAAGATFRWSSSDPAVATIDDAGTITARTPGRVTVAATSGAVRGEVAVVVVPPLGTPQPGTGTLRPGATVTIDGTGFLTFPGATSVTVSGAPAVVTSVTPTRITAVVPAQSALPCEPTGAGRVMVRRQLSGAADSAVAAASVDASTAQALAVGESVTMTEGAGCVRLDRGGRYLVSVFNASNSVAATASVRLRGMPASGVVADAALAPALRASPGPARSLSAAEREERDADVEHFRHLEKERSIVAALGSPIPGLDAFRRPGAPRPSLSLAAAPPNVGDTVSLNAVYSSCSRGTAVRARVVHVGARSVVYEDVQSPSAGQMDPELRRVGVEFDEVQFPILERNFGSPLAMDARLDNDGRIAMLFTRYVNDSIPGVIGYITSCNFYSPAQAPASNQRELFYARVPRFVRAGVKDSVVESAATWRYNLRATVIHEVKHLTSYGERFARAQGAMPTFEEGWLEESTARLAEEFYARTFSGATWKGNAGYAATIACEYVACAGDDRPKGMLKHYEVLADYYGRVGERTPLGAVATSDNTYYASGWLLVRWAIDHYASDEASFVRVLTTETGVTGLNNLARRTGRPAAEMLADWSLAMAADDRPGLVPRRAQLSFPSWNTRDVFRGLNAAAPFFYKSPFPLLVQQTLWGSFAVDVPVVRGWSAGFFELGGTSGAAPELLELRGGGGGPLSSFVGMAVLRVE